MSEELVTLPEIPKIRNLEYLTGSAVEVPVMERLTTMSADDFELFVLEWAHGYLSKKYSVVERRAGAGDKGRDIVGWIEPVGTTGRKWDNYQCKRYDHKLMPSDIWLELGKIIYYTSIGDYTVPQKSCFVAPRGVGPTLGDSFNDASLLRTELKKKWKDQCAEKIVRGKVIELKDSFLAYFDAFNFEIFSFMEPIELIEQHSKTRYHRIRFGLGLAARPVTPRPPIDPAYSETVYIAKIFEALSDHLKAEIKKTSDISTRPHLVKIFRKYRESFYSAESLRQFSRDNLPDDEYFHDLMEQVFEGIELTLLGNHDDGFFRMDSTCSKALDIQIDSNVLRERLRPNDRIGICHQLVNEGRIEWVL